MIHALWHCIVGCGESPVVAQGGISPTGSVEAPSHAVISSMEKLQSIPGVLVRHRMRINAIQCKILL